MGRNEILAEYEIDKNGRISNPGKFEGEMLYVPFYWDAFLNGGADRDDGTTLGFNITKEDKDEFPDLKHRRTVNLVEDSQGFVREV